MFTGMLSSWEFAEILVGRALKEGVWSALPAMNEAQWLEMTQEALDYRGGNVGITLKVVNKIISITMLLIMHIVREN